MPALTGFAWPQKDEEAILSSVRFQAGRRTLGMAPSPQEQDTLIEAALAAYPHTKVPSWCAGGVIDDALLRKEIAVVMNSQVKLDSSPGVPLAVFGKNEQVLTSHGELVCRAVIARIHLLASQDVPEDSYEIVEKRMADPVRFFVKNEPHPMRKLINKRFRLIGSVSLVDQNVERLLFTEQNKAEIADYINTPSMPIRWMRISASSKSSHSCTLQSKPLTSPSATFVRSPPQWRMTFSKISFESS